MVIAILAGVAYASLVVYVRKNLPQEFYKFNHRD